MYLRPVAQFTYSRKDYSSIAIGHSLDVSTYVRLI